MIARLPVTAIVPVRNEEANLARCLARLDRFTEVVVIDSGSTDRTGEIARSFGARVVNFRWNGQYPKKRNWFLLNETITTDWVFFIDADEYVDDAFCDELAARLPTDGANGYWLRYSNDFLGARLRHGLEQRKLALFRTGMGLYERIDENQWSSLDMEVHEHPIVDPPVLEIAAPIEHKDFKGLGHFIGKHRDYAQWEARRYLQLGRTPEARAHLTDRQRFKYRHLAKWWYPWFYFLFTYVAKRGLLDGGAGFHYAAYKLWYFQTIRLLIREAQNGHSDRTTSARTNTEERGKPDGAPV